MLVCNLHWHRHTRHDCQRRLDLQAKPLPLTMEKVSLKPTTSSHPVLIFALNDVCRRYAVLTKDYLLTYRERGNYQTPTESIKMDTCSTVKSSDDEINKEFSFVSRSILMYSVVKDFVLTFAFV